MDKLWHFSIGGAIFLLAQAAGLHGAVRYAPVATVAVGKEVHDLRYHGPMREHVKDVGATMLGAVAADLLTRGHTPRLAPVQLARTSARRRVGPVAP